MAKKDSFNYTPAELSNPSGQNDMSTQGTYYQRSMYEERIYPPSPEALDMWYDKVLYGRVDGYQNSIVPSTLNLKPIPSAATLNVMALNVVADVFESFVTHMRQAILVSAVDPNGNPRLLDVKAVKAHKSANAHYSQFTQRLFNAFMNNLSNRENTQIRDFNSFVKIYRAYIMSTAANVPITKTNYVISGNADRFMNGVTIAIANADAADDSVKYRDFIRDPNFEFFTKSAKNFGLIVDKNAPWIISADLFSPAFLDAFCGCVGPGLSNYVTVYGDVIDRHNFFDIFYEKTYLTDFNNLMYLFINSYINLVNAEPYYDEEGGLRDLGLPGASVETINASCPVQARLRKPLALSSSPTSTAIDPEILAAPTNSPTAAPPVPVGTDVRAIFNGAAILTDKFLIDLYIDLRQVEIESPFHPREIQSLKQQSYEMHQVRASESLTRLQNVAAFVNAKFRNRIYDRGSRILQRSHTKVLDNRVRGGRILVKDEQTRQLY
jgi:hypothetical protein